jgi:glycosyltransferase involved in cell wall biosynthesis/peptidoglycan/xylan/chitin deacetylase (PgdA/CDA1 family)
MTRPWKPSCIVVTPSVGEAELGRAARSVVAQTYDDVRHLVVVDGSEHESLAKEHLRKAGVAPQVIVLPESVGAGGFYGHRVFAASPFLVSQEIVLFLDSDNAFHPNHVQECVNAIQEFGADWTFALRRISSEDGSWSGNDNCASLGYWPSSFGLDETHNAKFFAKHPFLIDTSCYAIRRPLLSRCSNVWNWRFGADSMFASYLVRSAPGVCTGSRTVTYFVGADTARVLGPEIERGNEATQTRFEAISLCHAEYGKIQTPFAPTQQPTADAVTMTIDPAAAWRPKFEWGEEFRLFGSGEFPTLSFVIPVRNGERYLIETLECLVQQSRTDWEAIVVDDGSTDDSLAIAQRYQAKDRRFISVRQSQAGVSAARNYGASIAQSNWLTFLDSDDLLDPTYVERMLAADEADLRVCGWRRFNETGADQSSPVRRTFDESDLGSSCPFAIHAVVLSADRFRDVGGFDLTLAQCEDWDLWSRLMKSRITYQPIDAVLAFYRVRADSASMVAERAVDDSRRVIHQIFDTASNDNKEPARADESFALFLVWVAAKQLGGGRNFSEVLGKIPRCAAERVSESDLASRIVQGLCFGRGQLFSAAQDVTEKVGDALVEFVREVTQAFEPPKSAPQVMAAIAELLPPLSPDDTWVLAGSKAYIRADFLKFVPELTVANQMTDRAAIEIVHEGRSYGTIELPVVNGLLPVPLIEDAIAANNAWVILAQVVGLQTFPAETSLFREERFLQNGWEMFWEAIGAAEPISPASGAAILVELAAGIPMIVRGDPYRGELELRCAGELLLRAPIEIPARGMARPDLQLFLYKHLGMDLFINAARDSALGATGDSIRQRLSSTASLRESRHTVGEPSNWASGMEFICRTRERPGVIAAKLGSTRRRRSFTLDFETEQLAPAALVWSAWLPERCAENASDESFERGPLVDPGERRTRRHDFESVFAAAVNPYWDYSQPYEKEKYDKALSLIEGKRFSQALELGCAEGHFSELLVNQCDHLTVVDVSATALERCLQRMTGHETLGLRIDAFADDLPGNMDLVVIGEMLYYVGSREKLVLFVERLAATMNDGATLLCFHSVHMTDSDVGVGFDWSDAEFGTRFIGESLATSGHFSFTAETRTQYYEIQMFQKVSEPLEATSTHTIITTDVDCPPSSRILTSFRHEPGGSKPAFPPVETYELPILCYHRIASDGPDALKEYRVSPSAFEEQMDYLHSAGFSTVRTDDLLHSRGQQIPLPGRRVMITFDDGFTDFAEFAWPVLKKYGFDCSLFVPTAHVAGHSEWDSQFGPPAKILDWESICAVSRDGVEIGSHSSSHRQLPQLPTVQIYEELVRSKGELEQRIQKPVTTLAYPFGARSPLVVHIAGAAGYDTAFTTDSERSNLSDPLLAQPRLTVRGGSSLVEFVRMLGT